MKFKKLLFLLLIVIFSVSLVSCKQPIPEDETKTVETGVNDEYTLILQSSTMDGVFNPFFYSSGYDEEVIGLVNVSLLLLDPTGAVVAGDEYSTAALDYSIYYTDNLTTYAKKDAFEEGDYVVYEMVLKNGDKFSDGTDITADDVLFNYYVYLDPAYQGSSTLYTLPILGLQEYRTQLLDPTSEEYVTLVNNIFADDGRGKDYVSNDKYTEREFNIYWDAFYESGTLFAQKIVNYVNSKYLSDANVKEYFTEKLTAAEIRESQTLKVAYGMGMWGFGEISEDLLTLTGASGTVYNVADLTSRVYFEEMLLAYADEDGFVDYQSLNDTEAADDFDFLVSTKEVFLSRIGEEGTVPSIAGLVKGQKTISGETYETVKVVLTEKNPKAILSLGVMVAPKHYYNASYKYTEGKIANFGVEFNNKKYMEHLKSFNGAPMGAGPYKFIKRDEGDGTVYLERNEKFETMGKDNIYNAFIKKVAFKIIDGGAEYGALSAGEVHYANVGATSDVMKDIAKQDKLVSILVDNLGYGYICINPEVYPNIHERIALTSLFDLSKVYDHYPSGLADVIYRSQSQVSWAYPEGAQAIYPFDGTKATAIEHLKLAGFTFNEETNQFEGVPEGYFTFTLPYAADDHPAGGIFIETQELLRQLGITAEIKTDADIIANIEESAVGVYALAWQASADPDMYQVYHYLSQAKSVISNGIKWLYENGDDIDMGTIDVTKRDGSTVTMNQKQALEYLGELINEGTKYMLVEERQPIYEKALEVLAQLNIEIPTYQRKNLFIYNGTVIEATSLSSTVTPYWGPLAEIWKVKFVAGTKGNQTIEVPVK